MAAACPINRRVAGGTGRRDWVPPRSHLVGVAGSGMRALADVLAGWGFQVGLSDYRTIFIYGKIVLGGSR